MSLALSVMLQTTIVFASAALLTLGLRRFSASLRHTVWAAALFAVLILPLVAAVLPGMEVPVLPEGSGNGTISEIWEASSALSAPTAPPIDTVRNSLVRPRAPRPWSWQFVIAMVWFAGTFAVLVRLILGSLAVRRMGQTAEPVDRSDLLDILNGLRVQTQIKGIVRMKLGEKSVPPMTWGIFRHVILLPASALTWTADRQRLVLAHELAHVKRRDGVLQILVQVVCSLYWFNPLVWYAARQLRIERECACDNEVLTLGADADDYADHLLQVARAVSPGGLSMATVAMAHRSQLETRLLSILDNRTRRSGVSRPAAALLMLAVAAGMLTAASIRLTARPGESLRIASSAPLTLLPNLLAQAPGIVQGVVMQAGTGAPLKDVLVSLTPVEGGEGPQQRYDVETRPDGTFAVMDLPPGEYRMNLVHDDFVRLHSQSEPLHVKVGDGQSSGMRLHMMPGPAISGRIHDDTGNPRTAVTVDLLKLESREGARSLQPTGFSVLTDGHGEYRFFGLEAGEYYLRARPRAGTTGMQPVYYPGVSEAQHATPIFVRAGADITGINLALTRENLHSVRLKVAVAAPAPSHPELSFYVNPQSRLGLATAGAGMHFDPAPDGSYVSPLLAPGTYEIEVYLKDPDPVRWARTTVRIDNSDVDAGTVVIPAGSRITGRVNIADNVSTPVRRERLYVVLRPLDGSVFVLPSAKVNEDGSFVLTKVPERKFRVDITGLPPEIYLAAIRYNGREIPGGFTVGADPGAQLDLSVANAGGAVAGVVRNAKDQPVPNGHVVLFPTGLSRSSSPYKEDPLAVKTILTDQFGAFSIGGIAPGEYGILAWHSSDRTRLDTAFLMAVEDQIAKVLVERGFTNTVNVRALPPSN